MSDENAGTGTPSHTAVRYAPGTTLAVLAPIGAHRAYPLAGRSPTAPLLTVDGDGSAYGYRSRTVALRAEERIVVLEHRGPCLYARLDTLRGPLTLRLSAADVTRLGPTDRDALTGWEGVE